MTASLEKNMDTNGRYVPARFITRHNRFVGTVELGDKDIPVYIPNTGRLAELLIPGTSVLLTPVTGKYQYKVEHILSRSGPVMIDAVRSNTVFHNLLEKRLVPSMESFTVIRREPAVGNHRFDYELRDQGGTMLAELKSCTLFYGAVSSFPDAVSSRATAHVRALADTGKGMLIFFLLGQGITRFVPNYHTDFDFYRALMECRDRIDIRAFSAIYDDNFSVAGASPVEILYPEVRPLGSYLLVLRNDTDTEAAVGKLGTIPLSRGFYVYCGSGMGGLFKRIERHRRQRKKMHWHIDYIARAMTIIADLPIVGSERLECRLAGDLAGMGGREIEDVGSSDCTCRSHFFHFTGNPLLRHDLWDRILWYRLGPYL